MLCFSLHVPYRKQVWYGTVMVTDGNIMALIFNYMVLQITSNNTMVLLQKHLVVLW